MDSRTDLSKSAGVALLVCAGGLSMGALGLAEVRSPEVHYNVTGIRSAPSGRGLAELAPSAGDYRVEAITSELFTLAPAGDFCSCVPPLFADGFESADATAWSDTFP